jgi:hypothetical protein
MSKPRPIYRTDGEWMAILYEGHVFDTQGEWAGWLDGNDVYLLDGEYVGYISEDGRLLRQRVLPHRKRRRPPTERPRLQVPPTVPLPPLFAELSYDTIDVLQEVPHIFDRVSELRPDAGERSLSRLVDTDPRLAARQKLHRVKQEMLEEMVYGIIYSYGTTRPPVPIEAMTAGRRPGSTGDVETAPPHERLHMARQLIEQLGRSNWAVERGYCSSRGFTPAQIEYAARALLLPRQWILKTSKALRRPWALAHRYAVPEETVMLRLHDLE